VARSFGVLQTGRPTTKVHMKVGFIGLGQMGRGMATRLLERGHEVVAWNRTRNAVEALERTGAHGAADAAATLEAEIVITMLADDAAIEAVWIAPALVRQVPASAIHLNMATVSLRMSERLERLHAEAGIGYIAAPVFGRPHAAAAGQLDILAAGAPEALKRCQPLFETLGRQWFDLGAQPTHATIAKIARNYLLGTIIESLGEAFALVAKSGVDPARFLDIITSTSLNAPAYRNYGGLIVNPPQHPTFPLRLGLKDVELALQAARDTGVSIPMAAVIREQHVAAIADGFGDHDWAALGNYIAKAAGV
jgi:3-hydroxyisobutyrate dehydrogenase-like beta-hydroxyacid dehydrogenase